MNEATNRHVDQHKCRWCNGTLIIGDGPIFKPDWRRGRCLKCGTISYLCLPHPVELDMVYLSAWSAPQLTGAFAAGTTNHDISNSLLDAIAWNDINKPCLDFGAGTGLFAREIVARGGTVVAVEPYGQALSFGKPGQLLWLKSVDYIPSEVQFKWIFLIEVIEHMLDPVSELKKLHQLLGPNGKLVVTTPNAKGWRARKDGFFWREAQNPTHITLFTAESLENCLMLAGFSKSFRVRKPVNYGKHGLSWVALALSQMLGIDGGLRYIATK